MAENLLYYGDNLDVLRRHVADESVDLVYLDPPFKSDQDYNVLFAEHCIKAAAQIRAFEDTWRWDETAARAFEETLEGGGRVADALRAFLDFAPARRSPMGGGAPSAPGAGGLGEIKADADCGARRTDGNRQYVDRRAGTVVSGGANDGGVPFRPSSRDRSAQLQ